MNQKTAQRLARAIQAAHPDEVVEVVPVDKHNFTVETLNHGTITEVLDRPDLTGEA
jgi:hypothetical protein